MTQNLQSRIFRLTPGGLCVGTWILTSGGAQRIEDIGPGTRVLTLGSGMQKMRCVSFRDINLVDAPSFMPIRIKEGVLQEERPSRDVIVSPEQKIALRHPLYKPLFGNKSVLIPAKNLVDAGLAEPVTGISSITYVTPMFDSPQIVMGPNLCLALGNSNFPVLSESASALALSLLTAPAPQVDHSALPLH